MGIFDFLQKKKQIIEVYPIGKLEYVQFENGNVFSAFIENEGIKQNYEFYIYSESFIEPKGQIEYYKNVIKNWNLIISDIKVRLQKEKNITADNISLDMFGIYEKGKEPYDATLICSYKNLNFTVNLEQLVIKGIEFIE
jgi:hypothetical protein